MSEKAIIWCAIICTLVISILTRNILRHLRNQRATQKVHAYHHPIEMGRERDILFIPGDNTFDDDEDVD